MPRRKPVGSRVAAVVVLLLSIGLVPPAAEAADPFYTELLERGARDLERGDAETALAKLRTACFGFLDEPVLLAEGLMQLGRAQAAAGRRAELRRTFDRLLELESRFGAFETFADDGLKRQFASVVRSNLGNAEAEASGLFAAPEPAALPGGENPKPVTPRQQRKALEKRVAQNPSDTEALYELAELRHRAGKHKAAADLLDRLLVAEPADEAALCLRAQVAMDRKNCAPATFLASRCASATVADPALAFVLDCLVTSGQTQEARDLLDRETPQRRARPVFASIVAQLETQPSATAGPVTDSPTDEPAPGLDSAPGSADADPAQTPQNTGIGAPAIQITVDPSEKIKRLRSEARSKRFREELAGPLAAAVAVANAHPDSRAAQHLVAEIAYRAADYPLAVEYFDLGGEPELDNPELAFYLAVALFETGDAERARATLDGALPALRRAGVSEAVNSYIERIQKTP